MHFFFLFFFFSGEFIFYSWLLLEYILRKHEETPTMPRQCFHREISVSIRLHLTNDNNPGNSVLSILFPLGSKLKIESCNLFILSLEQKS